MRDALKSGDKLKMVHTIEFFDSDNSWLNKIWSKEPIQTVKFTTTVNYDALKGKYFVHQDGARIGEDSYTPLNEKQAILKIFSAKKILLLKNTANLKEKAGYPVNIKISFEPVDENSSWLKYISMKRMWEPQTLEADVIYVVPPIVNKAVY